ncbi:hypothetical protein [Xylanibacter ruminicola]|uniref:hypothetical protein n=1 Tax=Xylanibacter ruminicola TaxID=839 RepID=UPI00048AC214|nr:hypothetical protein [Xylanibacter ruminicola]
MKRYLFVIVALFLSLTIYAQDWIYVDETDDMTFYVSPSVRKTNSNYVAHEKCVPKNLIAERERLVNSMEDTNFYRYAYYIVTELVDIDIYRLKSLSFVYYDDNGDVIDSWNCKDDDWHYSKPGTIIESFCKSVEYLVNGDKTPSYTLPKTTMKPVKRKYNNPLKNKVVTKGKYIKK